MPISKNQIKQYFLLQQKKYRNEMNLFLAEGTKIVTELLQSDFEIIHIYCTQEWLNEYKINHKSIDVVSFSEIKKISTLTNPQPVLAIVKQKKLPAFTANSLKNKLTLFLDDIRDPGNLGTIIRIADWFGIENIVCSLSTVDLYNPKVIQATMGSFLRVNCFYNNLEVLIKNAQEYKITVYAALLNGKNIYKEKLPHQAVLVIGNEANGISKEIIELCSSTLTIPSFSTQNTSAESLNASIATAIMVAEFKKVF